MPIIVVVWVPFRDTPTSSKSYLYPCGVVHTCHRCLLPVASPGRLVVGRTCHGWAQPPFRHQMGRLLQSHRPASDPNSRREYWARPADCCGPPVRACHDTWAVSVLRVWLLHRSLVWQLARLVVVAVRVPVSSAPTVRHTWPRESQGSTGRSYQRVQCRLGLLLPQTRRCWL